MVKAESRSASQTHVSSTNPLNTIKFRDSVITVLKLPEHIVSATGKNLSYPVGVQKCSVDWSEVKGQFGFAVVSYRLNNKNYVSGVVATRGNKTYPWLVYELDQSRVLTQENLRGVFTAVTNGQFDNPVRPYTFIYGTVGSPRIQHVKIVTSNGTDVAVPVLNQTYGYIFNKKTAIYKISGYDGQGNLEWGKLV